MNYRAELHPCAKTVANRGLSQRATERKLKKNFDSFQLSFLFTTTTIIFIAGRRFPCISRTNVRRENKTPYKLSIFVVTRENAAVLSSCETLFSTGTCLMSSPVNFGKHLKKIFTNRQEYVNGSLLSKSI